MSYKINNEENPNKEFAEFFGTIMPHLKKLKTAGHILSGLTEAITIFQIINSNLSQVMQTGLIVFSLVITCLIVFLIEGGISRFFPLYVRQIISRRFKNRWYMAMFAALSVLVMPLVLFSPYLSGHGGAYIMQELTPAATPTNITDLRSSYSTQKDSIQTVFDKDKKELLATIDQQITATKAKYKSLIDQQNNLYNEHKKRHLDGHRWAKSHMDKATRKVKEIQVLQSTDLAAIEQKRTRTVESLNDNKNAEIALVHTAQNRDLGIIDSEDESRKNKREKHVKLWGGFLFIIALMASALVFIVIIIQQIYHEGAGHEVKLEEWNDDQSKWSILQGIFGRKWNNTFDSIVSKFDSKVEPKDRTQIGFKSPGKTDLKQSTNTFDSQVVTSKSNPEKSQKSENESKTQSTLLVISRNEHYNITNWWKRSNDTSKSQKSRDNNKAKFEAQKEYYEGLGLKVLTPSQSTVKVTPH